MDELHGMWIVSHKAVTHPPKKTWYVICRHVWMAKKPAGRRSEQAWLSQVASKGLSSPNIPNEGTGEVKTT